MGRYCATFFSLLEVMYQKIMPSVILFLTIFALYLRTMKEADNKATNEEKRQVAKEHPAKAYLVQSLIVLRNKYVLTIVVFLVWLTFFDRYNLVDMMNNASTIREMKAEKEYYKTKITEDSTRIMELTTNNENLEKFAREQYLMKEPTEEIFIVKQ